LKFLEGSPDLSTMEEKSSYTVMFGPDKCGTTNKVHLILRFKNAKTGEYKEHHLKALPPKKNTPQQKIRIRGPGTTQPKPLTLDPRRIAGAAADQERRVSPSLHRCSSR